jgi:hypothetical protein
VVVEGDAVSGGSTTPYGERVLHNARSRHAGFGRKAKIAWVAFGVILDEIRTAAFQEIVDHFLRQISPEILIRRRGMQIEMEAKITVFSCKPRCSAGNG